MVVNIAAAGVDKSVLMNEPLTWDEARYILREILQSYLEDHRSSSTSTFSSNAVIDGRNVNKESKIPILSTIIYYDLDLYLGALSLSLIMLIVISLSLHSGRQQDAENTNRLMIPPGEKVSLLYTELIGTTLLVMASFINIFVIRRRRFLSTNDKLNSKGRDIHKFLRTGAVSTTTHNIIDTTVNSGKNINGVNNMKATNEYLNISVPCQLTSQTEVYPVFRKVIHSGTTVSSSNNNLASWTTIPSLLLVKGDWIALQVGDIAPASCTAIRISTTRTPSTPKSRNSSSRSNNSGAVTNWTTTTTFAPGERVTMEALHCTTDSVTASLPSGRTTLQKSLASSSSDHFLTLCNNMHICILNDSPITSSLQRSSGTYDTGL